MTELIISLRLRLWRAALGRAFLKAVRKNETARENLNRAIRETLQR